MTTRLGRTRGRWLVAGVGVVVLAAIVYLQVTVFVVQPCFSSTSYARHRENVADGSGSRDMKIER